MVLAPCKVYHRAAFSPLDDAIPSTLTSLRPCTAGTGIKRLFTGVKNHDPAHRAQPTCGARAALPFRTTFFLPLAAFMRSHASKLPWMRRLVVELDLTTISLEAHGHPATITSECAG
jgi:hypothetical protein